jgi:hypothetical protein
MTRFFMRLALVNKVRWNRVLIVPLDMLHATVRLIDPEEAEIIG